PRGPSANRRLCDDRRTPTFQLRCGSGSRSPSGEATRSARVEAVRSGVAHAFEHGNFADLGGLEVVPEDAAGAVVLALDVDHRAGSGDQITGKVVVGDHQVLAHDLDRVDRGADGDVVVDLARLDQDPVLEVVVAAAFAYPRAAEVDGDRAAEDEVDLRQVVEGDDLPVLQRALDRRRLLQRFFR